MKLLIVSLYFDRQMMIAISCSKLSSIQDQDWMAADVLGIDEGQFFEDVSANLIETGFAMRFTRYIR